MFKYDNNITEKKLLEEIGKINNDDDIDGFIVQLPLPNSINQENIFRENYKTSKTSWIKGATKYLRMINNSKYRTHYANFGKVKKSKRKN